LSSLFDMKHGLAGDLPVAQQGPMRERSRQLYSAMRGFSEPSAISPASTARSGPKRSSGSDVK